MNLLEGLIKAAESLAEHVSPIHGAGKIVDMAVGKEPAWTGSDSYRTEQDIKDTLDVNGDGEIDLEYQMSTTLANRRQLYRQEN